MQTQCLVTNIMSIKLPAWLAYEAITLTEGAAIACVDWIGKGKEKDADAAAVKALRERFNHIDVHGTVVIGEGERDEAPMLYIGEEVGNPVASLKIDIAVDPLEGTTICANAMANSISVMALAPQGTLLHAPDLYMEKIAVGCEVKPGEIDLDNDIQTNLKNLAKIQQCEVSELIICILDRPRHESMIKEVRNCGARVQLIGDGDVAAAIATSFGEASIDMYIGTGGAPEGVLAAAALKCLGGFMQGRLIFKNDDDKTRAKSQGIKDLNRKYTIEDMVKSDVIFSATGVTTGWVLEGVEIHPEGVTTNSLLMHYSQANVLNIVKNSIMK
jgi:fructose-1,6-bisphosphatase II / sedoheptulose-1,7-bisphosphatase